MPIIGAVRRLVNQKSGPIGCVVKKSGMGSDRCCSTDIAVMSGPLPLVLSGTHRHENAALQTESGVFVSWKGQAGGWAALSARMKL